MQAQQAPLIFADAERPLGERLMKLALETDRVEGYTEPHAVMIARLAESIGKQVGLHGQDLTALKFAALAHDIGERGLKRNYLLQPNALSWEETLDLWRHPILGEQSAAEFQLPRQTQLLIRWHQEWWNGQGYPDGLTGATIPIGARILRAVDSYCALISQRPYRQRYELPEAEQVIADLSGIEFDPQIAKLLLAVVVAERRQREVEVWSVPSAFEPPFAPMVEEMPAPAVVATADIDGEPTTPVYAPDADTLTDAIEYQSPQPTVEAAAAEYQMLQPTVETAWSSPEERVPTVMAETEAAVASAAPVELAEPPASLAARVEALTAAPYGDVLMHQASDNELPMQAATDEAPSIAHHDSTPDDQHESSPKIPS